MAPLQAIRDLVPAESEVTSRTFSLAKRGRKGENARRGRDPQRGFRPKLQRDSGTGEASQRLRICPARDDETRVSPSSYEQVRVRIVHLLEGAADLDLQRMFRERCRIQGPVRSRRLPRQTLFKDGVIDRHVRPVPPGREPDGEGVRRRGPDLDGCFPWHR
jgi:hypothetical protein